VTTSYRADSKEARKMGEASDDKKREKQGGEGEVTDGDGSKPPATKSNLDLGFFFFRESL